MVFHGFGPVGLENCSFTNCSWHFSGPAANAVQFMTALYAMGGGAKDLIDATLANIRSGKNPMRG
jgi:hypothetical protein